MLLFSTGNMHVLEELRMRYITLTLDPYIASKYYIFSPPINFLFFLAISAFHYVDITLIVINTIIFKDI
jgi:hypothetical protein